jgi:hypothetical protein
MMDDLTQQFNIPQVKLITSTLNNFIIQPSSLTLCAQNIMFASMLPMKVTILFTHKGGVKVGDVNAEALILSIPIHSTFPICDIVASILKHIQAPEAKGNTC